MEKLVENGFLELKDTRHFITDIGRSVGGEFRSSVHGGYFLWPSDFCI